MSLVSSYNLLSLAPVTRATGRPGKPHAVAFAAAASAVALPSILRKQSSRVPLFVCRADGNEKYTYEIQPFALVHPKFPKTSGDHWTVTEEADRINLWFFVDKNTPKDKLEVATEGDVLLVRYAGDSNDETPASKLDVRLLMPPGYDKKKVEAELKFGSLLVTVTKPPKESISPNKIPIGDKP